MDKRSRTNTLEAANVLAESDKIESSKPDFLFLSGSNDYPEFKPLFR